MSIEKLKIKRAVIVEGRYDKGKLSSVMDGVIIRTDGFGIFKDNEKKKLIKKYAETAGIIILTDSDSAGRIIRNHIKSFTDGGNIVNLYIPKIKGKEKRKNEASKEGFLGVEGFSASDLRGLLLPFSDLGTGESSGEKITRTLLYDDGFFGTDGSDSKRKALLGRLGLPDNLNVSDIISASGVLFSLEEYENAKSKL
ncbi:MAG: DUF4093 domain-containing protein [Ruminococcaceae bacterium]|nr:DUF4093 domain-containing protein [Oscillospiraceae bacterium]